MFLRLGVLDRTSDQCGGSPNFCVRWLVALTIVITFAMVTVAAPGDLDTSFGYGGTYIDWMTNHPSYNVTAWGLLNLGLQPDGKILAVGAYKNGSLGLTYTRVLLRRYLSNGMVDTQFGMDGFAVGKKFQPEQQVEVYGLGVSVVVQPDGKIVVGGYTYADSTGANTRFTLWRFTPQGELDTTFGNDGILQPFNTSYGGVSSVRLSDGKILAAGEIRSTSSSGFVSEILCRFNLNGTFDTGFNPSSFLSGIVTVGTHDGSTGADTGLYPTGRNPLALTVQSSSGDIYIGGHTPGQLAIARYNHLGQAITTFGNNGIATTNANQLSCSYPGIVGTYQIILLHPDGKLNGIGPISWNAFSTPIMSQHQSNGAIDTGFGNLGFYKSPCPQDGFTFSSFQSAAMQTDGKTLVYGANGSLIRINTDGSDDFSFSSPSPGTGSIIIQPADGKIIGAGQYYDSATNKFYIMLKRFLP